MKTQSNKGGSAAAVKIGTSRQVVIPRKLHDQLGLAPGDYLEVELERGKVVFTPKTLVDKRVEAAVAEGLEDLKEGRYSGPFGTADEAIESLHKAARTHRPKKSKRA